MPWRLATAIFAASASSSGLDHATFRAGDVFGRVEAEAAQISDGADLDHAAAFHQARRADGVRCVFDDLQIVTASDRTDSIHVAGLTGEMHRHQRTDVGMLAAGQRRFDFGRVDVEGVGVDIDEDRPGAEVAHYLGRRG